LPLFRLKVGLNIKFGVESYEVTLLHQHVRIVSTRLGFRNDQEVLP